MAARGAIQTSLPVVFCGPGDKPPIVLDTCWDLEVYLAIGCRILCQKVGFLVSRDAHVSRYAYKSDLLALNSEIKENSMNVKVTIGIVSIA